MNSYNLQTSAKSAQTLYISVPTKLIFFSELAICWSKGKYFWQYSKYQRWSRGHKARGQGHKKIRGQGQEQSFRGQTLSRPRTGMLEAKDQGHRRKCSPKKKGLQKVFQAISNL